MIMERKCANCGNGKWRDGVTAITDTCFQCRYVGKEGHPQPSNWIPKAKTNADRIRAMSDEELADWIDWLFGRSEWCDTSKIATDDCSDIACTACILKWLKQPVED
jgi:hypothetical protein